MAITSNGSQRKPGTALALALLMPVTMAVMGIVVLLPVLPSMMAHFKDTPDVEFWVPLVLTTPALMAVLFSPLAGYLADLIGRRLLLIIALFFYAVLGTAPIYLNDLHEIWWTRVGVGMVEAMILTVSTTLIGDFFKGAERDGWLALQTAVSAVSSTVLIFIAGFLGEFGWWGPFCLYGSSLILLVGILVFTWEPQPDPTAGEHQGTVSWAGFPWRAMAEICAITLYVSILFYLVLVQLSFALNAIGVSDPIASGNMQAIASLGVPVGTLILRKFSNKPVSQLLLVEFLILGTGFIGMGLARSAGLLVACALFNQIGAGMALPTLLIWAQRRLPFELRGRGTGIWQSVFSVGQFCVVFVVTFLMKAVGGLSETFIVIGASALVAALIAVSLSVRSRAQPREA